jgi:selenocysteine lyase/cysteine desulfurase
MTNSRIETRVSDWSRLVVGSHSPVPLLDGSTGRYINLDCASTAPPLTRVVDAVSEILPEYGSIGRGGGWKSDLCTAAYEAARDISCRFVGGDRDGRVAIFVKQATDAINLVASRVSLSYGDVVVCTLAEHHANLLPWRRAAAESGADLITIDVDPDTGAVLVDELSQVLDRHASRVKLVAMTGASNVTGHVPDIHAIAELVHAHEAMFLVDGAQLVPHRAVDVRAVDDPARIDFLAFSGHKMYAPYGAGLLVANRCCIEDCRPHQVGGGAASWVSTDEVAWRGLPHLQETGSPNLLGVVAMAAAAEQLTDLGMDRVREHEVELTEYALDRLRSIPSLILYGAPRIGLEDRLGVFTFNLNGIHHRRVAAILSYEHGIATRSGAFCAHPYVSSLVAAKGRGPKDATRPGAVRASLGVFSTKDDIDALLAGLEAIVNGESSADYLFDKATGTYRPSAWDYAFSRTFPPKWERRSAGS